MTRKMRRKVVAGASLVALLLGGASMAWACTRSPAIYLSPAFGQAGSQTQVNGGSFLPGEPVEIHWGSKDGPVIGRATAGANYSFSVAVVIPPARDGVYYVVATAPGSRGQASFEVGSRVSRNSDPESQPERRTSTSGSGSEATSSTGGNTSGSTSGGSGSGSGAAQQSGDLGFAEQPQRGSQATPAVATQTASSPDQASQPVGSRQADGRSGGSATAGGPAVGSAVSPSASGAPAQGLAPAPADDQLRSPTPRSATADLWSGFNSGNAGSLTRGLDAPVGAPAGTTPMAVGVGILSAGMAALGLGFGVAELRRKRVLAGRDA